MKDICLIIPCYNSISTLDRVLLSIKNQTYKRFDTYLAVDGDDHLLEYLEFGSRYSAKVLYFDENKGAGATRQRALDKVKLKYKYVMFVDSDDLLNPRALEILHKAIVDTDSDIAYSNILRQLKDGTDYLIDVTNREHRAISWCAGKLYKISFLTKNKIRFRDDLRLNEDIYFNFVAFNSTKKIVQVKETTYIWLYNDNSTTTKDDSKEYHIYNIKQSILASTYSILDLAKKNKNKLDESLLAIKLMNIYTISQEAIARKINLLNFENEYKLLSDEIDIVKFVESHPEYYIDRLYQLGMLDIGQFYYYSQTFLEFIKFAYTRKKK